MNNQQSTNWLTKQRILASAAWTYFFLIVIATVMLGTFFVAFMASLKDDALKDPANFSFAQVQPSNWYAAAKLGAQGNNDWLNGGIASGKTVVFQVTYAVPHGKVFEEPKIVVPRRAPGTGMAAVAYPHYAADYVSVSTPTQIHRQNNVRYQQQMGIKTVEREGHSVTWQFSVHYAGSGPIVTHVPLDITTPRYQVLIDSSLPPTRYERRGRVASWVNITPGVVGYVFRSYVRVWNESVSLDTKESLFWSWTVNSFFIALGKMILTVLIACAGGYALARLKFSGNRLIFFALVFSMAIPLQVGFISNYEIFNSLNLLNTPWAVIGMLVASAQVLIMKQFFEGIPTELEEAARVDGASHLQVLIQIFMPLAKPAVASVAILAFQGAWNDFFWPLVVLTTPPESYTLPVGLLSLRNAYGVAGDWNLILAGSFLSTIPVLIIFIMFQKYFVNNDMGAAVKG